MSKQDVPPEVRAAMKLFGESQLERIEEMNPEQLDDALRAQGLDPNEPFGIDDLLAKLPPEPAAPVIPLSPKPRSPRRMARIAWIAVPAAAAVLFAIELPKWIDAWRGGPLPLALHDAAPESLARAAALRDDAAKYCDGQRWRDCARSLDDARDLDPAGESQERVAKLRQAIALFDHPVDENPVAPAPSRDLPRFEAKPPIPHP